MNALGNSVPPLLIFPRVHFKEHMLKGAPAGSVGVANLSGWTNCNIFMQYLRHFKKHSYCDESNKILLILGNHDSHISVECLNFAKENGIVLLTLPPPLDRSIFGPLKNSIIPPVVNGFF